MFKEFQLTKHQTNLPKNARVLVAVLDWGIGHATRCIPIIKQLKEQNYTPIIASSGSALQLLKVTFPDLKSIELPSYDVQYSKTAEFFTVKLLSQVPKFIRTYYAEKKLIRNLVSEKKIDALISDNRFGVFHRDIPSIYLTHQLRVKSGITTFFTSKIHQKIIQKYTESWVPDRFETPNLSGDLSHNIEIKTKLIFVGLLSQFNREKLPVKYDILLLLSGPEPQRSLLEKKLLAEFSNPNKNICLVRGVIENKIIKTKTKNRTIYNYALGKDLQRLLNESDLVIARSGYSTIMDLAVLGKKALFIPTPGQEEQNYLAKHIENQGIAPFIQQKDFRLESLDSIGQYTGF